MFKKIVIIGNGAAGHGALEEILSSDTPHQITVITKENEPIYYRPMLSEYLSQALLPNRFFLKSEAWYKENQVDFISGVEVSSLDVCNKRLTLSTKEIVPYDELILATGGFNFIPPMPGATLENVLSLRTLKDANLIKSLIKAEDDVVIIGGGLLGLEIGWQLLKLGAKVTVVEMMERLLPRQLDEEASKHFESKVDATGIRVLKGVQTKELLGDSCVTGVLLGNGQVLKADLVLFSIGIRADVTLAKAAGLNVQRGIVVNDQMMTSEPNVYAAGDCAEHKEINYGIWPEAITQGKIAGANAIGKNSIYEPVIPFNIYHGMDMRLFSIGDVGTDPSKDYDSYSKVEPDHLEKCFFVDNRLVGAILIGNIGKSAFLKKAMADALSKDEVLKHFE